jgi:hypothetical protein
MVRGVVRLEGELGRTLDGVPCADQAFLHRLRLPLDLFDDREP